MPQNHRVDVDLATYEALLANKKRAHAFSDSAQSPHVGDNVAFVYEKPGDPPREVAVWRGITHIDREEQQGRSTASLGRPRDFMPHLVRAVGVDPGLANTGICALTLNTDTGEYRCDGIAFVKTKSQKAAGETHLRKTVFTVRRVERVYRELERIVDAFVPDVVGVEQYTVYEGKDYQNLRDAAQAVFQTLGVDVKRGFPSQGTVAFRDFLLPHLDRPDFFAAMNKLRIAADAFRFVRGRGDAAQTLLIFATVLCTAYRLEAPVFPWMPADIKRAVVGKKSATKADIARGICERVPNLEETVQAQVRAKGDHEHVYDAAAHAYLSIRKLLELRKTAGL